MKRLPEDIFDRLFNFIGYGNLDAPVWFIGPEERLLQEKEDDIVRHLEIRRTFEPVECCRQVHLEKLKEPSFHREEPKPKRQPTYDTMSEIMLRVAMPGPVDPSLRLDYQAHYLGISGGNTLLTELLPLPKQDSNAWPDFYSREFDFAGLADYKARVLTDRVKLLRLKIELHKPAAIVCYGATARQGFQQLFDNTFDPVEGDEEIQIINSTNSVVIRTNHLCAKYLIPGHRAQRIADLIRPKLALREGPTAGSCRQIGDCKVECFRRNSQ